MPPRRFAVHHDAVADLLAREWLLTNGLGGFAMASLLGANTRRYHGLLVASTTPPVGRLVAIHSLIEQLDVAGATFDLATHQFGADAMLHPDGWIRLESIIHNPPHSVTWVWRVDGLEIMRTVRLLPWTNALRVSYEVTGGRSPVRLRIRLLTPLRDFHSLDRQGGHAPAIDHANDDSLVIRRDGAMLQLRARTKRSANTPPASAWMIDPQWWRDFAYLEEHERGLEWREDVWSPGFIEFTLDSSNDSHAAIDAAVIEPHHAAPAMEHVGTERDAGARDDLVANRLHIAADQFIVRRKVGAEWSLSVIAGYPWFGDWGRDTMISLPGLMLDPARPRVDDARTTLLTFARHMRHGLVPNLFDDRSGGAHYNTVDASLWFIHAVHELSRVDPGTPGELLDACGEIITAYCSGTHFGIAMDGEDGLITAGDETTQLTWMDAKRDGVVFTSRFGKAIEINALWHHALWSMAAMMGAVDRKQARELEALARLTGSSIESKFWWSQRQCCHDVLVPLGGTWAPDGKLRPNQIFAVSLPHSALSRVQQQAVVRTVRHRLLTPVGLRTLDPSDPDYIGRFEGDLMSRDAAYHQGTVWPWLLGPFCEAILRVNAHSAEAKADVGAIIQPLIGELDRKCIGQLAEVYDGDPPHRPGGCPAQAWSIAELLRIRGMIDD